MSITVGLVQMISSSDMDENLKQAREGVSQCVSQGAELVVLPENFAIFGQKADGGPVKHWLLDMAAEFNIDILGGTIPLSHCDEKYQAACIFAGRNGELLGRYNKIHLFDANVEDAQSVYRESDMYYPGQELGFFERDGVGLGVAVCYDLRFPELFQMLRNQGASVIFVPAAFTEATGVKHWEVLLRARAIETQCYIVAVNQGGRHDEKRSSYGHSMIVSPDGVVLASLQKGFGVLVMDLDMEGLEKIRRDMPVFDHKKFSIE